MAGKLVIEEGDLKGLSLTLEEGDFWTIGRDPDECQFVLEDPLVSRRHLLLRRTPEGFTIENLSETNPAQLNDEDISDHPHLLTNGDSIKIGNETLRYYEDVSAHILEEEAPLPEEEPVTPQITPEAEEEHPSQRTLFEEEEAPDFDTAEIDFGVVETGRWLLKVVGGPNNGAEFYMQTGNAYTLGTDPQSCDIVFHDTSVSRQHAKVIVTPEETLTIEDLRSRNGVLVGGNLIEGRQPLAPSTIVTLGTTSFVIYDREGEMQTIISPLLPSIVKVLQQEAPKPEGTPTAGTVPTPSPVEAPPVTPTVAAPPKKNYGPYIILSAIIALFALAGIGTTALFRSEPIVTQVQENADELIRMALKPYPAVRYTFNKSNGGLLLLGHVSTVSDKNQLIYHLQNLKFIKDPDASQIVIDEYVWQEMNSILSKTPAWRDITMNSPSAGQFVLSGYLPSRKQAEQLSSYINLNFPYLDLLKKQIVVEEDVITQITNWLQEKQLTDVVPKMNQREVTLSGNIPAEKSNDLTAIIDKIKLIPGVRIVNNQVSFQTAETGIIDVSDHYQVTGKSKIGDKLTVVINGRILSEGDELDGMDIQKITPDRISLEKDGVKYRIDY